MRIVCPNYLVCMPTILYAYAQQAELHQHEKELKQHAQHMKDSGFHSDLIEGRVLALEEGQAELEKKITELNKSHPACDVHEVKKNIDTTLKERMASLGSSVDDVLKSLACLTKRVDTVEGGLGELQEQQAYGEADMVQIKQKVDENALRIDKLSSAVFAAGN